MCGLLSIFTSIKIGFQILALSDIFDCLSVCSELFNWSAAQVQYFLDFFALPQDLLCVFYSI